MLIIGDVLIKDDLIKSHFACELSACRGACCWEGDYGAPLEDAELSTLAAVYPEVAPYLDLESRKQIEEEGLYVQASDRSGHDTALMPDGACVFLVRGKKGIAYCGIERAYRDGKIDWPKPVSCHLYPIRIRDMPGNNLKILVYDRWVICSPACSKGARENTRVYEFAKAALIRKYGQEWYDELEAAAQYLE